MLHLPKIFIFYKTNLNNIIELHQDQDFKLSAEIIFAFTKGS